MYVGGNINSMPPVFLDENYSENQTNTSNQLHLLGNVNYFENECLAPMIRPNNRGRETEDMQKQQKLQVLSNLAKNPKANTVSTGLRLSYDDDEPNSSVSSASGSSIFLPNGDNLMTELDRQKEEFDQYIKIQAETMAKGIRDMNQRHVASLICGVENGISKKLHEKDTEIESMNRRNQELVERIKRVTVEAQNWQHRAKYNESVVNVLKSNLQKMVSQQGLSQAKEGFGDSEIQDDAASYVDPNGPGKGAAGRRPGEKGRMGCRACKVKEASVLLVPCSHLCLCKECDVFVSVCPVCQLMKTASLQVYF